MEAKSNLLPERAGQADVMTVAGSSSLMEPDPDAGHWYSPAAVRVILQAATAERDAKLATAVAALELIAVPVRSDGTWNRSRAACQALALAALGAIDA